jgi:hypothetical protein
VEIAVFHSAERLGLTCAKITRTVNRLSHVLGADVFERTPDMPALVLRTVFPNDLESQ